MAIMLPGSFINCGLTWCDPGVCGHALDMPSAKCKLRRRKKWCWHIQLQFQLLDSCIEGTSKNTITIESIARVQDCPDITCPKGLKRCKRGQCISVKKGFYLLKVYPLKRPLLLKQEHKVSHRCWLTSPLQKKLRIYKVCKEFHMKSLTPNLSSCSHAGKSWILPCECCLDYTAGRCFLNSKLSAVCWCSHSSSWWYAVKETLADCAVHSVQSEWSTRS